MHFGALQCAGSAAKWERTEVPYQLDEESCIIYLRSFCWVKYDIDDKIVEAKKILVYTAKEKITPDDEVTKIDVAYRLNLPGAKEVKHELNKHASMPLYILFKTSIQLITKFGLIVSRLHTFSLAL